jgi:small basic protein
MTTPPPAGTPIPRTALLVGAIIAIVYGVLIRVVSDLKVWSEVLAVMSVAFVAVVPAVVGFLAVRPTTRPGWSFAIFFPWFPTLVVALITGIIGYEGAICIVMALPILLVNSSIGGLIALYLDRRRQGRGAGVTATALVLPFLFGAIEGRIPERYEYRLVESRIDVAAPAHAVWREIVSVREIGEQEMPGHPLFLRMGFPRPLSAEIDREAVGGIRRARFAGGVLFLETVTDLAVDSLLSFKIAAQTDSIPPTTLDPHVTIGGPYFDVLQGTYTIERLGVDSVRLHLQSRLRVSTHFNWYAALWADAVMGSIQRNILGVERQRAERR